MKQSILSFVIGTIHQVALLNLLLTLYGLISYSLWLTVALPLAIVWVPFLALEGWVRHLDRQKVEVVDEPRKIELW